MSDEIPDDEAWVQKFCDDLFGTIEFAINSGLMKPEFRGVRQEGEKKFKVGFRDLIPVIDQSPLAPLGRPALLQVITGTAMLIFGATYTDSTKIVIINKRQSERAKHPRKARGNPIIEFIRKRLKRTPSQIEDALLNEAKTGDLGEGITLEDDVFVVRDAGTTPKGEWKLRLARRSLPRTISKLKKNISGR